MESALVASDLATVGQRASARVIDILVVLLLLTPLSVVAFEISGLRAVFVMPPAAYFLLSNIYGATVGKRSIGLTIVRGDGRRPGVGAGARRASTRSLLLPWD